MTTMKAGSEVAFQTWVLNVAEFGGFRLAYHTHDSRRSQRGFPDLVLVREETDIYVPELVIAELKGAKTRVQPAQVQWLDAFRSLGLEVHLWRDPDARPAIEERLLRPRRHKPTSLGVCPTCESADDVAETDVSGILICRGRGCGTTWSGVREPIAA